jgi:aspartate--ammonia ligase
MKKKFEKIQKSDLSFRETEKGIKLIKDYFETVLSKELGLIRVTAPRFVKTKTGIQDDLSGKEKSVTFKPKLLKEELEIVHSLAKWKRLTLATYKFKIGEGLYTDMDAIRKDDLIDETHSLYVDQWDWELVISSDQRSLEFLKKIVKKIYFCLRKTEKMLSKEFIEIKPFLPKEIKFIHTKELEDLFPYKSPKEREDLICEKYGAVFLIGIGDKLKSGKSHDIRAPDYDDWTTETVLGKGLNGDILLWHPILKKALEISSMGIRVDKQSLLEQLKISKCLERQKLYWHKMLLNDKMPLSIGGGIGQSRLCMFFLRRTHIGEVQSSVWSKEIINESKKKGILLL